MSTGNARGKERHAKPQRSRSCRVSTDFFSDSELLRRAVQRAPGHSRVPSNREAFKLSEALALAHAQTPKKRAALSSQRCNQNFTAADRCPKMKRTRLQALCHLPQTAPFDFARQVPRSRTLPPQLPKTASTTPPNTPLVLTVEEYTGAVCGGVSERRGETEDCPTLTL